MPKKNYSAWNIETEQFPISSIEEQIRFLIGFAILAPSGHNSQPWKFKINQNTVYVLVEPLRSLAKSDPLKKQLAISLGCMVENFCIAADFFDFETNVEFLSIQNDTVPILKINLIKKVSTFSKQDHLIFSINRRGTNRNKYKNLEIPQNFISECTKLSTNDIKINFIFDRITKEKVIELVIKSQIKIMEDFDFRNELSELIKPNFTQSKIGMPGFSFGLPTIVSILASFLIKKINMSKLNQKGDEKILRNTPAFLTVCVSQDRPESWLNSGRIFEKVWLMAVREGLAMAPNAAPVAKPEFSSELIKILDLKTIPILFSRVGFSEKISRHTPRLNQKDVITT